MFTGLVEEIGQIVSMELLPSGRGRRLRLAVELGGAPLPVGASLAVDGVCLTVTASATGEVTAEVGPETLERTTLGSLGPGAAVNLEQSLRLGDRLGGHWVAGHVDGVGRVESIAARGEALDLSISTTAELLRYVVEKGSIAVDGISLTINRVSASAFAVSLIPHTQAATTLGQKGVGALVNLEVDLIGKYVEKLIAGYPTTLKEQGVVK